MTCQGFSEFGAWLLAPFRSSASVRRSFWLVFTISIALRAFIASQSTWMPVSDSQDYHELAYNLMSGRGYTQIIDRETTFYAYRMPGYPLILATTYTIFGTESHRAAMAVNIAAEAVTELCVFIVGFHLLGATAALAAQSLWAVHLFWAHKLLTESVFTASLATSALLMASGLPFSSGAGAFVHGIIALASALIRPIGLCVYLAAAARLLMLRVPFRRAATLLIVALLPTVLGLSLWGMRNQKHLGSFVPLSTNFGRHNARSFGINPDAVARRLLREGCNDAEINARLTKAIVRDVEERPGHAIQEYGRRLVQLLLLSPRPDRRIMHLAPDHTGTLMPDGVRSALMLLYYQYYVVYALAAAGGGLLLVRRVRFDIPLLIVLSFLLLHPLVSPGNIRFAEPLYPFYTLLAGAALAGAVGAVQTAPARNGPTQSPAELP